VHYLLLSGVQHPLRDFYPDVIIHEKEPRKPSTETYNLFQDFVWKHVSPITKLIETRLVQTNVVRRTTCLIPLFALVAREADCHSLSLIEVGTSAGLNLHWDRYQHDYHFPSGKQLQWGDDTSPVRLSTEVRGEISLPAIPSDLSIAWRMGIDLNPIDINNAEAMLWLRALIFPEHVERHHTIEAAASVARQHPAKVVQGDAVTQLPLLMPAAPTNTRLCLYASMVLNQLSPDSREALWKFIAEFSKSRPVSFITMDGTREGWSRLQIRDFANGRCTQRHMANAHAHGRWLEWLDTPQGEKSSA
jgi:hypothetical protein